MSLGYRLYNVFVRWPRSAMWITAIVTAVVICRLLGVP